MLYPSIDKLLEKLDSKYTLVAVASKRARELREQNNPYIVRPVSKKQVGMALEEVVTDFISYKKINQDSK